MSTAFYRAHAAKPENKNVQRTLADGLQVVIFDEQTPGDVRKWLKEIHNEFHTGAGKSYLDALKVVKQCGDDWEVSGHSIVTVWMKIQDHMIQMIERIFLSLIL